MFEPAEAPFVKGEGDRLGESQHDWTARQRVAVQVWAKDFLAGDKEAIVVHQHGQGWHEGLNHLGITVQGQMMAEAECSIFAAVASKRLGFPTSATLRFPSFADRLPSN